MKLVRAQKIAAAAAVVAEAATAAAAAVVAEDATNICLNTILPNKLFKPDLEKLTAFPGGLTSRSK